MILKLIYLRKMSKKKSSQKRTTRIIRTTGISINVLLLGVVSFLNDLSSEMIMPILPMFISALGGAGVVVGLIGGLRDSISSILKVVFGYLSDRTGRRKIFVSSGYLTSAVFKLLLMLSKAWQHVLAFASLERVGKGLRTAARDAIIADSMPKQRGKGFGVHRAFDTAGAICGSLVAFALFWFFGFEFKSIIFMAAMLAFLSLVPLSFVKERKRKPQKISLKLGLKNLPTKLKLFILISAIFALANFSYMFFILRAQELFIGRLAIGAPILLYVLFNIFYAGFAIPFGTLSDKIGRRRVITFGYLIFSLTSFGFAFFNSLSAFMLLFALYGIANAIINATQRAYVSDLSPSKLRATSLGTFHTTIGLVSLPASLIAGFLWQSVSPASMFVYGGSLSIISAVLFIAFRNFFTD